MTGGSGWIDSTRFDVQAKPASAATREQLLLMLRPLLADRFKLAFHRETKELPVYALVVAKGGPKFQKPKPWPESAPRPVNHLGYNVDMAWLAKYLTRFGSDMPVIDKTGLAGNYDLDLDMEKISAGAGADAGGTPPSIGSVFQATVDAIEDRSASNSNGRKPRLKYSSSITLSGLPKTDEVRILADRLLGDQVAPTRLRHHIQGAWVTFRKQAWITCRKRRRAPAENVLQGMGLCV